MGYIPKCPEERTDCFARLDGSCRILNNVKAYRATHTCPFYQPEEAIDPDVMKAEIKAYAIKKGMPENFVIMEDQEG